MGCLKLEYANKVVCKVRRLGGREQPVSSIIISVVSVCPVVLVGVGPPFHPSVPSSVQSSVHPSSSSSKKKMMEESTTIKKLVSAS
jgi:hypothetical protein